MIHSVESAFNVKGEEIDRFLLTKLLLKVVQQSGYLDVTTMTFLVAHLEFRKDFIESVLDPVEG